MHKIYKYLIAFSITLVGFVYCVTAQISDLTFSKPYFESTLQIINRNITDLECIEEYGYHLGNNELLVFGLSTWNMGQHDAAFPSVIDSFGNILPDSILHQMGLHWDDCHWHIHTDSLYIVVVRDVCYNAVAIGAKIGFNFQDMGNWITWILSPNGIADHDYLLQYGVPDYSLQFHPPNDNFNGDTRMGLSAGYYDTYSSATWGNSVPTTGLLGDYFICVYANYDKYFNQGLNIFPDSSATAITITPQRTVQLNSHTTICPPPCDNTNPDPQSIYVTGNVVNWDSTGACNFNDLEIIIWHEKKNGSLEYRTLRTIPITTETSYTHSDKLSDRDLQRWASKIFDPIEEWTFSGGGYSYGYKIGNTIYKP
jgi:hypothetical protein